MDLDIVKEDSCRAAVEMVVAKYDRLDVVIHNAGHLYIGITEAFTAEQIAESVNVNALGAHRLNRAALPIMRRQGAGTLVYNGSGIPRVVGPFMGPYAVGKQAFDALAEATAYEVNPFGIETVIVMPGAFTEGTSHFASHVDPEDAATLAQYARLKADQEKYDWASRSSSKAVKRLRKAWPTRSPASWLCRGASALSARRWTSPNGAPASVTSSPNFKLPRSGAAWVSAICFNLPSRTI